MFDKARDMYRLQKEAKKAKKELKKIHIEAEHKGVTVVIDAEMTVVSIAIAEDVQREKISVFMKEAMNKAMKKAQVVASERMQGVMGLMGNE